MGRPECRPDLHFERPTFLESVAAELEKATRGNLLGAPLYHGETRRIFAVSEPLPGESVDEHKAAIGEVGRDVILQVEHFDDIPKPIEAT